MKKKRTKKSRRSASKRSRSRKRVVHAAPQIATGKDFYLLNPDFEFFDELRLLMLKPSPQEKGLIARKVLALGRIKLAVLSGIFLAQTDSAIDSESLTDLLIVGEDINRRKLSSFLQGLEAEVGKEIKTSIMDLEEFDYRYKMFDRFVRVLLEGPHEKIVNKLGI